MKKKEIAEGTRLRYVGKGFENFNAESPYVDFLGYDSHGWSDVWVEYNGEKICLSLNEVEIAS